MICYDLGFISIALATRFTSYDNIAPSKVNTEISKRSNMAKNMSNATTIMSGHNMQVVHFEYNDNKMELMAGVK